jgi:hypothetical protein
MLYLFRVLLVLSMKILTKWNLACTYPKETRLTTAVTSDELFHFSSKSLLSLSALPLSKSCSDLTSTTRKGQNARLAKMHPSDGSSNVFAGSNPVRMNVCLSGSLWVRILLASLTCFLTACFTRMTFCFEFA